MTLILGGGWWGIYYNSELLYYILTVHKEIVHVMSPLSSVINEYIESDWNFHRQWIIWDSSYIILRSCFWTSRGHPKRHAPYMETLLKIPGETPSCNSTLWGTSGILCMKSDHISVCSWLYMAYRNISTWNAMDLSRSLLKFLKVILAFASVYWWILLLVLSYIIYVQRPASTSEPETSLHTSLILFILFAVLIAGGGVLAILLVLFHWISQQYLKDVAQHKFSGGQGISCGNYVTNSVPWMDQSGRELIMTR